MTFPSESGRLLTTRDVAQILGVCPETVLRWIDTRGLPARRLTNRAIRFREDEVEAWLDEHATGAATEKTPVNRRRAHAEVSLVSPVNPPPSAATTEKET
jgi:excisionase family DNA binding protein